MRNILRNLLIPAVFFLSLFHYQLYGQTTEVTFIHLNDVYEIAPLEGGKYGGLAKVALTHTPSPMGFLSKILNRPPNERPFLLIPVGYPSDDAKVPDLKRKSLDEIIAVY